MSMGFQEKLIALLKSDARFVDDAGELVTAAVTDRAWKIDHGLVRRLLSCAAIKAKFFDEIDGHWVFNTNTFIDYVSDKNFLANSYTRFRNRIGLNIDDKFLRERGEVSLVWPYKDCVLEGGQTKEEEKRRELFFNEVLAQDEIDRLFDPKVLTNWKRYTVEGEEDIGEIKRDGTGTMRENLLIKGNNLLALHTLKKQFRGQVKLIYIDPPYNTGNDSFGYNDSFNHASWLTFMKNRLEVARELLREDGVLFVNCDDNEQAYVSVLLDELFGRGNFVANFIWNHRKSSQNDIDVSLSHNYLLAYAKDRARLKFKRLPADSSKFANPDHDPRGPWVADPLDAPNIRPNLTYPILNPNTGQEYWPPAGRCWRFSQGKYEEAFKDKRIVFGKTGKTKPQYKRFLREAQEKGVNVFTIWDDVGTATDATKGLMNLFESRNVFSTAKPEGLLERILQISTQPNDLILDFFAGAGTTAAVAHKMGRQWITVEQMGYVDTMTLARLQKVVGKRVIQEGKQELDYDQGGISKAVNWRGGGDFLYCELMQYNQAYIDKISCASSSTELVALWRDIAENSFLNWYVNPETPDEAVADFMAIGQSEGGLAKQKQLLTELLNKNQLYVNLAEIDDADFGVSEEDKALNCAFYGDGFGAFKTNAEPHCA